MSAFKTRTVTKADGIPVTEIETPDGSELTGVWIQGGHVYWEDPGACTVQVGTPLEFHEWMVLHTKS